MNIYNKLHIDIDLKANYQFASEHTGNGDLSIIFKLRKTAALCSLEFKP